MILVDTDILTLVFASHARAIERMRAAPEAPVISAVARIEVLQGRFDSILKAADANALLRAQDRLARAEKDLEKYRIIPFDADAGVHFDRLRQDKKIKKDWPQGSADRLHRIGQPGDLDHSQREGLPIGARAETGKLGGLITMESEQDETADDFSAEVESLRNKLRNNREFMALMERLSREKAAISLQDSRKELGV